MELLVKMAKDGRKQVDMAAVLHCSQATISNALARLKTTPELVKTLMASQSTQTLQSWRKATRKAANRGDHRPAREWLEMAHPELRPVQGSSAMGGQGGITIIIGTPTAPLTLPDVVISTAPQPETRPLSPQLTPSPQGLEGETTPKP